MIKYKQFEVESKRYIKYGDTPFTIGEKFIIKEETCGVGVSVKKRKLKGKSRKIISC